MVRSVLALAAILAAMLLLGAPAFGATARDGLTGTASADSKVTPAQAPPSEDPRCVRLRQKLMEQKLGLAHARSNRKRAFIRRNMGITRRRLANDGCTA